MHFSCSLFCQVSQPQETTWRPLIGCYGIRYCFLKSYQEATPGGGYAGGVQSLLEGELLLQVKRVLLAVSARRGEEVWRSFQERGRIPGARSSKLWEVVVLFWTAVFWQRGGADERERGLLDAGLRDIFRGGKFGWGGKFEARELCVWRVEEVLLSH